MTVSVVQTAAGHSASAPSFALAYTGAVTPGNTLIAVMGSYTAGGLTWGVSDSVNGAWSAPFVSSTAGSRCCAIAVFPSTAAGTPTVTVTPSASEVIWLTLLEATGLTGVSDKTFTNNGTATTSDSVGPTATLTGSGELAVCVTQLSTASTGWAATAPYTLVTAASNSGLGVCYYVVPTNAAQTAAMSWTTSASYAAAIATFLTGTAASGTFSDIHRQLPAPGLAGRGRGSQFAQPVQMGGMNFMPLNENTIPNPPPALPNVTCGGSFDWILSPTTGLTP